MTDAPALAITGATGTIGRLTAEELARGGTPLRLLARDPGRAPHLPQAVVVESSYSADAQAHAALAGVTTLLMVSAGEEEGWLQQQLGFVSAAADAGVEHVVYTSFQGAAADATFSYARDHFATEEAIRASGMAWTMLRDSFYLDFLALLPDAGEITGPEALSFTEVAETLSAATGRRIRYVDETLEEARRSRAHFGAPDWQLEGWITTYTAIARGEHAHVSHDVELLTGRTPISLRELVLH